MSVPPSDRIFARRELGIVTHLEGSAAAGNSLGGHGRDAGAGEGGLLGAEGDGRLDGGHVHGDGSHCALVGAMDTDASVRVRRAVMALAGGPSSLIFSAISQEKPEKWTLWLSSNCLSDDATNQSHETRTERRVASTAFHPGVSSSRTGWYLLS